MDKLKLKYEPPMGVGFIIVVVLHTSLTWLCKLDDEVQRNEAIPPSDEEIALDASSEGTLSPGGPRYDYMMSSEEAKDDY
ncbi:hypothetical protein Tco_0737470 [Tanacetum coccineum]